MKEFLILLAQQHVEFRITELEALADLHGIRVDFANHDPESPFLTVQMESCDEAVKLVEKTILCRAVYELYGQAGDFSALKQAVQDKYSYEYWRKYDEQSFRFDFVGFAGSRPSQSKIDMIEAFKFMDLKGPIRMKKSDLLFAFLEDWEVGAERPKQIYFGRWLSDSHRKFVDKYDLKKRRYIGTTSFEAELAQVTCNIAQLSPGKLMYDPFAGTGSFLVSAGHCGAMSLGSDIDVRMIKGKGQATIDANFKQYGFSKMFLDVMTMDFTHNAFRSDLKFDAIVCDPPYGVREGLKVLGSKDPERTKRAEGMVVDGVYAHMRSDYIPPKKPYQFNSLLDDLLQFAAEHLPENGRLCFWMPTSSNEYTENDIPLHPDLKLLANCSQNFNKWSRRLLVYTRRSYGERGQGYSVKGNAAEEFRDKYFRAFN